MKRIVILALGLMILSSCEDDPVVNTNTYPTDNLALPEVRTSILISSYNPSVGYASEIPRLVLQDAAPDALSYLSVVTDGGSPLYSPTADSLAFNQPLAGAPSLYLNRETVDFANLFSAANDAADKRPIATVNHKVSITDTAWIVDAKVKFWKDTINPGFRIATYMTANVRARNYNGLGFDLNVTPAQGVASVANDASFWDGNIPNIDSSGFVAQKNDPFNHRNILVKNFNPESAWGFSFEEYSPFGQSFSTGDIIGTSTTPIRHYFLRPETGEDEAYDPGFGFTPGFVTVIWVQNEDTFKYEYINSVMTVLD